MNTIKKSKSWTLITLCFTGLFASYTFANTSETSSQDKIEFTPEVKQCLQGQYDQYIDASLVWYQDLTQTIAKSQPKLEEVSEWFLTGRTHHFELNRAAFNFYLNEQTDKINLNQSIESWLVLSQPEIRQLSQRQDKLGEIAKQSYEDRQKPPHPQNYQLRSAFAEQLSQSDNFQPALDKYNQKLQKLSASNCIH